MLRILQRNLNIIIVTTLIIMLVLTMVPIATASSSMGISSPTIIDMQSSIQLPSGSQIYLYGGVTGGASYTGNFAYSDKGIEAVSDADGYIAAQLAMSSSNENNFQTNCMYYAIGGVGISGFNSYNAVYGYNNSVGSTQTSVQFNLPENAMVIIIAIASGGLNYVTIRNIPGFSTDASDNGGHEGILIGHAFLSPGNYIASVIAAASGQPGASHMVVLAGVYEFFSSGISTITNTASNNPSWAFNGSYADYNIVVTHGGYSESIPLNFNISQVNYQKQTFTVNVNYGGIYSSLSGSYSASFNNPSPFPAVSPSDLSILKTGKAPPDMSGAQITIGVNINVPAGSFNTIEINNNGEVIYVDASTGLIVEETGGVFGTLGGTLELVKTNIQNNPTLSFIWVVLAVVVIISIAAIVLIFRKRTGKSGGLKLKNDKTIYRDQRVNYQPEVRLKKLKDLYDKGLINEEEYEEQKGRILENK
ncbi:MAG: SHOCT domain-containing protein [Thermoprotei archaeon]